MLSNDQVLAIFRQSGALLEGHFLLASGAHSPAYLEKFLVLQYPEHVVTLCTDIADRFRNDGVDVVLGPTTGGVLLAYEVAKQLGVRGIFAERAEGGGRELRRGFTLAPENRVLVVDDILTSGGSVRETLDVVARAGSQLVGVGILADRSGGKVGFGTKLEALLTLDVVQYQPDVCPLCAKQVPLTKRGTTKHPAVEK
jgi:orotate phosphoribosyltransferase